MTIEQMVGATVVVLTNLKTKSLADYPSHGMVMCAETPDGSKIEFLQPPEGSQPGDVIEFEGFPRNPPAVLPAKKNNDPFGNVREHLLVDENGLGCYVDPTTKAKMIFKTQRGECKAASVKNGLVK